MKWSPPKAIAFFRLRKSTPPKYPQSDFAAPKGGWKKLSHRDAGESTLARNFFAQNQSLPKREMYFKSSHSSLEDIVNRHAPKSRFEKFKDLFVAVIIITTASLFIFTGIEWALAKKAKADWTTPKAAATARSQKKTYDKSYALRFLKNWRSQNQTRLNEINQRISELLGNTQKIDISGLARPQKPNESKFINFEKELNELSALFQEHKMRQDFLNRMILQVEKFHGNNLRNYVRQALIKMSRIEATSQQSTPALWKFMSYLAVAIKTLPERNEDVMGFIEGYTNFSSISRPIRPDEYVSQRDYTDGTTNLNANGIPADKVGDVVEQQLNKIDAEKAANEKKKIFELRRPILKDVTQEIDEKEISKDRLDDWREASVEETKPQNKSLVIESSSVPAAPQPESTPQRIPVVEEMQIQIIDKRSNREKYPLRRED